MDRPHSSASRDEDRASSRDNLSQSARRMTPHSTPGAVSPMSGRDEIPVRGFQPYRPGDDLRPPLSSALALDHAAAAAAAAYSYTGAFLPPHAFSHPAFSRFDDPLLLERYRMMQSPYLPYPQGMMTHPGLHPLLAAGARYPADLFPPQFPPFTQPSRISDRSPSMLSERQRLEEEKQRELEREREKEREREREKDRELALQRERQRVLEREAEKLRNRDRLPSKEEPGKDKQEASLSAKFGSIIQGTPKGLGIADRYPRVSSSSSASLGKREERKNSQKDEYAFPGGNSSRPSSHRCSAEEHEKRMSLVNPLREGGGKAGPPPLVSPRSHGDSQSRSSRHDSGLFRPFDSQQVINGHDNHSIRRESMTSDLDNRKTNSDRQTLDRKCEKAGKDLTRKSPPVSSAFHTFANHVSKMESEAQILLHSSPRDSVAHGSQSAPLNVPLYSSSHLQSNIHRDNKLTHADESRHFVSKLDLEQRRKSESWSEMCCSDSECDYNNEDDEQGKKLLISSGPPLKLDTSPKKIKLLSELGLTTFSDKKDADFEKWRKRRRRMKERSVSPVSIESGPPTPLKTPYRSEELCQEPDYKLKCHFLLQNFQLHPVPADSRKLNEMIKRACDEEKRRRLNSDLTSCDENLLNKTGVKRKLEEDVFSPSQIDMDSFPDARMSLHIRDPSFNKTGIGKSTSSPALDRLDRNSAAGSLKRPNVFGRSFVQEFHDSVLQSTRQKEMQRHSVQGQKLTDLSPSKIPHMMPWQPFNLDLWPGVDGVMETYQKHHQGENLEKQILIERNKKLREENARLNSVASQLSQRMEELLMNKRQLEELRFYNQEHVDTLKSSIKKLK